MVLSKLIMKQVLMSAILMGAAVGPSSNSTFVLFVCFVVSHSTRDVKLTGVRPQIASSTRISHQRIIISECGIALPCHVECDV